jgi:hypothetical protein
MSTARAPASPTTHKPFTQASRAAAPAARMEGASPSTQAGVTVSAKSAAASWRLRNKEKSKPQLVNYYISIERDAQLLANRIALLKQEEMRTWKKIEETKKRATEVITLKQKNEIKIQQKMEQLRMQQMMQEDNQKKINEMRQQRDQERQKI